MQATLERLRSAEQTLQLRVTSLNHEVKQKDQRLQEADKHSQQLEEQLSQAKAQLESDKGAEPRQVDAQAGPGQDQPAAMALDVATSGGMDAAQVKPCLWLLRASSCLGVPCSLHASL